MNAHLKPEPPATGGVSPADLDEMEAQARTLLALFQMYELGPAATASHVYARAGTLASLKKALEMDVPALAARVRTLEREATALRKENLRLQEERQREPAVDSANAERLPASPPEPAPFAEAPEDLGALLSAPFQVTPELTARARDEPLAALAMQVARALGDAAKPELERARLIAMAFAASRGDMDAFWTSRRQRGAAKQPKEKKPR
jgi:hypothetical protein